MSKMTKDSLTEKVDPIDMKTPLYEDPDIKIEVMPNSPEDHYISLHNEKFGEPLQYIIQRGILREYARTPRHRIEQMMRNAHEQVIQEAFRRNLKISDLGMAISQAHHEEERRYQDFADDFRRESQESQYPI